jgi:hypothetical protein
MSRRADRDRTSSRPGRAWKRSSSRRKRPSRRALRERNHAACEGASSVRPEPSEAVIVAVDLFCGAGGLTHGLEKAGVQVRLGVDLDHHCEYPYVKNNAACFLTKSVADLSCSELKDEF